MTKSQAHNDRGRLEHEMIVRAKNGSYYRCLCGKVRNTIRSLQRHIKQERQQ